LAVAQRGCDAHIVIKNLAEAGVEQPCSAARRDSDRLPSARERFNEISRQVEGKRLAVFLDYDGTLTPIARRPDQAKLSNAMRASVQDLARRATVAIISGRDLKDVRARVGLDHIFYAGSHGFDIAGPGGREQAFQEGQSFLPELDRAEQELTMLADRITGAHVERKRFSIAVHYREVPEDSVPDVKAAVDQTHTHFPRLRKSSGKKIFELQPDVDWHKGKALQWLLTTLGLDRPDVLPLYIGDDVTDEDAFRLVQGRGIGIVVRDEPRATQAAYALENPEEVKEFLMALTAHLEKEKACMASLWGSICATMCSGSTRVFRKGWNASLSGSLSAAMDWT
jgi:trehalose 6-phosphate phosphatase